ncbi:MAG: hypothetical protein O7D95_03125 [Betaproteobacteria bacterium]|nr:hypothetical protein [Betaproteobacteria bacterium]
MAERTLGQKVHQWMTNVMVVIPLLGLLGGTAIYGNSETVKTWIHGDKAVTTEDPVLQALLTANADQEVARDVLTKELEKQRVSLQSQINTLKAWHR